MLYTSPTLAVLELLCHSPDLWQDLVRIEDAVGIKRVLDLVHQIDHRLWLGVPGQQFFTQAHTTERTGI